MDIGNIYPIKLPPSDRFLQAIDKPIRYEVEQPPTMLIFMTIS